MSIAPLILDVFAHFTYFGIFFFWLIIIYSLLSQIVGSEIAAPEEYESLNIYAIFFFHAMRNSVGDLQVPHYPIWYKKHGEESFENFMLVGLVWLIWIAGFFLMCVILLNFLIALISQSFENTMQMAVKNTYGQRS